MQACRMSKEVAMLTLPSNQSSRWDTHLLTLLINTVGNYHPKLEGAKGCMLQRPQPPDWLIMA